jgi:hypothetical protein
MFGKKLLLAFVVGVFFLALSPLAAQAGSLTIVNRSTSILSAIYISASSEDDWEENLLDGSRLSPGKEFTIQIRGSYRKFDLRIEAADGGEEDYFEFPGNTKRIIIKGGGDSEYQ